VFVRLAHVDVAVGEVGAAAARDADFFGHGLAVVEHQHLQAALACHTRTKKAGCTRADHHYVKTLHGLQCRRVN